MTLSFEIFATVSATTKRAPTVSGNKRGAPAENLTGLSVTGFQPVDPELVRTLELETGANLLRCFVLGSKDIVTGDILVVSSVEYPIRGVKNYPAPSWGVAADVKMELIVEELRR